MSKLFQLIAGSALLATALLAIVSAPAHAGIIFTFSEVGANVVMNSSGVIDTDELVLQPDVSEWSGTGIEENGNHDIMGGTAVGQVNVSFGFHAGTDFSPWASANGPWAASNFSAIVNSGIRGFTTYIRIGGVNPQVPGLGVESGDIVAGLWAPDQNWTFANSSFASMSVFPGTYTVTDAVTAEFITFQVGPSQVPEPATVLLTALGLVALGFARRKQANA